MLHPACSNRLVSYSCCDGPMLLSFIVDHPDPSTLEHTLHFLWSGCGGKVYVFRLLPWQQVTHSPSSYSQLMVVLLKQFWKEKHTLTQSDLTATEEVCLDCLSAMTSIIIYQYENISVVCSYVLTAVLTLPFGPLDSLVNWQIFDSNNEIIHTVGASLKTCFRLMSAVQSHSICRRSKLEVQEWRRHVHLSDKSRILNKLYLYMLLWKAKFKKKNLPKCHKKTFWV